MVSTRLARAEDIPAIMALQKKYHVNTISEEDKPDGFVTTLFTEEQLRDLIEREQGITLLEEDTSPVGYAMAGSWAYWSAWPLFREMISMLPQIRYRGETMSTENSYQYGPICIEKRLRGTDAFPMLFQASLESMRGRYPYMLTFVNRINPRSYNAHVRKAGCEVICTFPFNGNTYWFLGTPTDPEKR